MILIPFPPSANNIFPTFGKRRLVSARYAQWRETANSALAEQVEGRPIVPPGSAVSLRIIAIPPDKRARDLDNLIKPIQDLLAHYFGFNDTAVCEIVATKQACERDAGRVLVDLHWT